MHQIQMFITTILPTIEIIKKLDSMILYETISCLSIKRFFKLSQSLFIYHNDIFSQSTEVITIFQFAKSNLI